MTRRGGAGAGSVLVAGAALLATAGALWAHAVVVPGASVTRAYETYTLRVPNERDVPTRRVHIEFPPEVFVVSFAGPPPDWTLDVERDDTGRAVAATWTGTLAPNRFVELSFVGVNPAEPTTLVWPVDQTYVGPDGEDVVSWSGPADSEFPASRTEVRAPGDAAARSPGGDPAHADGGAGGDFLPPLALLLSLTALAVSLRALKR